MTAKLVRAFLDDSKANPEDDTPRLILADWLEENGATEAERARGEFVRLQVRLTQEPRNEPLRKQCDALLKTHRAAWLGPLSESPAAPKVGFERGLGRLETTTRYLLSQRYREVSDHPAWPWIEHLSIGGHDKQVGKVFAQPFLDSITGMEFSPRDQSWIEPFTTSEHLHRLVELSFRQSAGGSLDARRLVAWPGLARLRRLRFSWGDQSLGNAIAEVLAGDLSELRALDLIGTGSNAAAAAALARNERLAKLERLQFRGSPMPLRDLFDSAAFIPVLRELDLSEYHRLDADSAQAFATAALPALRHLSLSGDGNNSLASGPWVAHLETLQLNWDERGLFVPLLAAPLVRLRELTVQGGRNPRPNLTALVGSEHLTELRCLAIAHCSADPEAAQLLASWPGLARLRWLGLTKCGLDAGSVQAFLDSPHLTPATQVDLRGNKATPGQKRAARKRGHFQV